VRVRYTPRARRDLEAIYTYIDEHNAGAARAVKLAILRTTELLGDFPYVGTKTNRSPEFRGIVVTGYPYRIYYRIRDNGVWIVHIRDVRRRPWQGE
jgi:plasmid stabilization system protein ParE